MWRITRAISTHTFINTFMYINLGYRACQRKKLVWVSFYFYASDLKGPPRATSNQIVHLFVCLSICLSVILSCLQSAIFKVLYCNFIYGLLTLHWHSMPQGWGQGQNVGLRDFLLYFGFVAARGIRVLQTRLVRHRKLYLCNSFVIVTSQNMYS